MDDALIDLILVNDVDRQNVPREHRIETEDHIRCSVIQFQIYLLCVSFVLAMTWIHFSQYVRLKVKHSAITGVCKSIFERSKSRVTATDSRVSLLHSRMRHSLSTKKSKHSNRPNAHEADKQIRSMSYSSTRKRRNRDFVKDNLLDIRNPSPAHYSGIDFRYSNKRESMNRSEYSFPTGHTGSTAPDVLDTILSGNNKDDTLSTKNDYKHLYNERLARPAHDSDFHSSTEMVTDLMDSDVAHKNTNDKLGKKLKSNLAKSHFLTENCEEPTQLADRFEEVQCFSELKDESSLSSYTPDPYERTGRQPADSLFQRYMSERKARWDTRRKPLPNELKRNRHRNHLNPIEESVSETFSNVNIDEAASDLLYGDLNVILNKYSQKETNTEVEASKQQKCYKQKRKMLQSAQWTTNTNSWSHSRSKCKGRNKNDSPISSNTSGNKAVQGYNDSVSQNQTEPQSNNTNLTGTLKETSAYEERHISSTSSWSTPLTMPLADNDSSRATDMRILPPALKASNQENHCGINGVENTQNVTARELYNTNRKMSHTRNEDDKYCSGSSLPYRSSDLDPLKSEKIFDAYDHQQQKLSDFPLILSTERARNSYIVNRNELAKSIGSYSLGREEDAAAHILTDFFSHTKEALTEIRGLYKKRYRIQKELKGAVRGKTFVEKFRPYIIPRDLCAQEMLTSDNSKCATSEGKQTDTGTPATFSSLIRISSGRNTRYSYASDSQRLSKNTTESNIQSIATTLSDVQSSDMNTMCNKQGIIKPVARNLSKFMKQHSGCADNVFSLHNVHYTNVSKYGNSGTCAHKFVHQILKKKGTPSKIRHSDKNKQLVTSQTDVLAVPGSDTSLQHKHSLLPSIPEDTHDGKTNPSALIMMSTLPQGGNDEVRDYCSSKKLVPGERMEFGYKIADKKLQSEEFKKSRCFESSSANHKTSMMHSNTSRNTINPAALSTATNFSWNLHITKPNPVCSSTGLDVKYTATDVVSSIENNPIRERESEQSHIFQDDVELGGSKTLIPQRIKNPKMDKCKINYKNKRLFLKHSGSRDKVDSEKNSADSNAKSFSNICDTGQSSVAGAGQYSLKDKVASRSKYKTSEKLQREKCPGLVKNAPNLKGENKQTEIHQSNNIKQVSRPGQKNITNTPITHKSSVSKERLQKASQSQDTNKSVTRCMEIMEKNKALKSASLVSCRNPDLTPSADQRKCDSRQASKSDLEISISRQISPLNKACTSKVGQSRLCERNGKGNRDKTLHENKQTITEKRNYSKVCPSNCKEIDSAAEDSQRDEAKTISSASEDITFLAMTTLNQGLMSSSPISCKVSPSHNEETCFMGKNTLVNTQSRNTTVNHKSVYNDRIKKPTNETAETRLNNAAKNVFVARSTVNRSRRACGTDESSNKVLPPKYASKQSSKTDGKSYYNAGPTGFMRRKQSDSTIDKSLPDYNYNKSSNTVDDLIVHSGKAEGNILQKENNVIRCDRVYDGQHKQSAEQDDSIAFIRDNKDDRSSETPENQRNYMLPVSTENTVEILHKCLSPRFCRGRQTRQAQCFRNVLNNSEAKYLSKITSSHNISNSAPGEETPTCRSNCISYKDASTVSHLNKCGIRQKEILLTQNGNSVCEKPKSYEQDEDVTTKGRLHEQVVSNQTAQFKERHQRFVVQKTDKQAEPTIIPKALKKQQLSKTGQRELHLSQQQDQTDKNVTVKEQTAFSVCSSAEEKHKINNRFQKIPQKSTHCKLASNQFCSYNKIQTSAYLEGTEVTKGDRQYLNMSSKTKGNNVNQFRSRGRGFSICRSGIPKMSHVYCSDAILRRNKGGQQNSQALTKERKIPRLLRRKSLLSFKHAPGYNQSKASMHVLKKTHEKSRRNQTPVTHTEHDNRESMGLTNNRTCHLNFLKSTIKSGNNSDRSGSKTCIGRKIVTCKNKLVAQKENAKYRNERSQDPGKRKTPQSVTTSINLDDAHPSKLFVSNISPTREHFSRSQLKGTSFKNSKTLSVSLCSKRNKFSTTSKTSTYSNSPIKSHYSSSASDQPDSEPQYFAEVECASESTCRRTKLVRITRNDISSTDPLVHGNVKAKLCLNNQIITDVINIVNKDEHILKIIPQLDSFEMEKDDKITNKSTSNLEHRNLQEFNNQTTSGAEYATSAGFSKTNVNGSDNTELFSEYEVVPCPDQKGEKRLALQKDEKCNSKRANTFNKCSSTNQNIPPEYSFEKGSIVNTKHRDVVLSTQSSFNIMSKEANDSYFTRERLKLNTCKSQQSCRNSSFGEHFGRQFRYGSASALCGLPLLGDDDFNVHHLPRDLSCDEYEKDRISLLGITTLRKPKKSVSSPDTRKREWTQKMVKCQIRKPGKENSSHFLNLNGGEDLTPSEVKIKQSTHKSALNKDRFSINKLNKCQSFTAQHTFLHQELRKEAQFNRQMALKNPKAVNSKNNENTQTECGFNQSYNFSNFILSPWTTTSPYNSFSSSLPIPLSASVSDREQRGQMSRQTAENFGIKTQSSTNKHFICKKNDSGDPRVVESQHKTCYPDVHPERKECVPAVKSSSIFSCIICSERQSKEYINEVRTSKVPVYDAFIKLNKNAGTMANRREYIHNHTLNIKRASTNLPKARCKGTREFKYKIPQRMSPTTDKRKRKINNKVQKYSVLLSRNYSLGCSSEMQERLAGEQREDENLKAVNIAAAQTTEAWGFKRTLTDFDCAQSELRTLQDQLQTEETGSSLWEANKHGGDATARGSIAGDNKIRSATTAGIAIKKDRIQTCANLKRKEIMSDDAVYQSYKRSASKLPVPIVSRSKNRNKKSDCVNKSNRTSFSQRRPRGLGKRKFSTLQNMTKNNNMATLTLSDCSEVQRILSLDNSVWYSGSCSTIKSSLDENIFCRSPFSRIDSPQVNTFDTQLEDPTCTSDCYENSKCEVVKPNCDWYKLLQSPYFHSIPSKSQWDSRADHPRNVNNYQMNSSSNFMTGDILETLQSEEPCFRVSVPEGMPLQIPECLAIRQSLPSIDGQVNSGYLLDTFLEIESSKDMSASPCSSLKYYYTSSDISLIDHSSLHTDQHPNRITLPTNSSIHKYKHCLDDHNLRSEHDNYNLSVTTDNCKPKTSTAPAESVDTLTFSLLREELYRSARPMQSVSPENFQLSSNTSRCVILQETKLYKKWPGLLKPRRSTRWQNPSGSFYTTVNAECSYVSKEAPHVSCRRGYSPKRSKFKEENSSVLRVKPPNQNTVVGKIVNMFENKLKMLTP